MTVRCTWLLHHPLTHTQLSPNHTITRPPATRSHSPHCRRSATTSTAPWCCEGSGALRWRTSGTRPVGS
eukprot:54032-Eustigmatos_ZCMA.PRE.1